MPRGVPMPYDEFMGRMEFYYDDLRFHRKTEKHFDPIFCSDCCALMSRGSDRARYMGKSVLAVDREVEFKASQWEEPGTSERGPYIVVINEDGYTGTIRPKDQE